MERNTTISSLRRAILDRTNQTDLDWVEHTVLITGIATLALPLLVVILISTQSTEAIHEAGNLQPGSGGLTNYRVAISEYGMLTYIRNSLIVALTLTAGDIVFSLLAALALVYFRLPYKNAIFFMILFTLLFPLPVRLVPLYEMMVDVGWTNSHLALIMPGLASATAVFLFRQHFLSIPDSLAETARIDDVGPIKFLVRVLIPMSKGVIAGIAAIQFIHHWGMYLWPLIVIRDQNMQVATVGLKYLQSITQGVESPWGVIMAGAVLTLLPPLVVLLLVRRPLLRTMSMRVK